MAWRMVKQPNGKYARFSEVIDNFTHCDLNRSAAIELCRDFLGRDAAEQKVIRADESPERYEEALATIENVHGVEAKDFARTIIEEIKS